ncbi:MAG: glutathione S-transferase family protein [Gammaproteobacteria bacterium]|jgi:glutathione S-transferase|nr:glutathione S-transferase family protein [Gammaproteobacteria bacterium]MDH3847240.1 glutathione S-transferase family protein [Gammaproteobacteria bacterium]MDH3862647.1 glutathione S-transferase family protein [Gammaproteobacteria bacterium]MDH3908514.1 glutathione S-transferase family protein [Gammaproteobacteria bacterium]MDH3953029.1 glutathione S-transferase family protein [Gammaproteobacteria bacterium]
MKPKLIIGNKNYSSWSLRAWLLLREADIDFDEHRIVLDTDDTAREIAGFSPAGRVPVLLLDGFAVWDTLAIAETLAERWSEKKLWPEDAAVRAHARSISAEMHSGFGELRARMPMNCRAMGRRVALPDELTTDIDRVIDIWSDCHRRYGDGGPWLFGEFSIADAMYAPAVLRLRTYGINLPESARHYPQRLLQSEAMQEWLLACETEIEVIEHEEVGQ